MSLLKQFAAALAGVFFPLYVAVCCTSADSAGQKGHKDMTQGSIEQVLSRSADRLMSVQGVVGIGQGLCGDKPCIKVFVVKITDDIRKELPAVLEGYPVEIEETGEIRPLREQGKPSPSGQ